MAARLSRPGTLILTFANYWVGPTALYPIIYSWIILYAFYFFSPAPALAHTAFVALAVPGAAVVESTPNPVVRFTLAIGTPLIAGVLVSRLLDGLRGQAEHASAQARALRDSESRTRMILESAHDAFVGIDRDGLVTGWNRAAEAVFGWAAAEAVGKPLASLILPRKSVPARSSGARTCSGARPPRRCRAAWSSPGSVATAPTSRWRPPCRACGWGTTSCSPPSCAT